MRKLSLLGMVVAVSILTPGAAAGGGWWSSVKLDGRHVAPGMEVVARADAYFMTSDMREQARNGELAFHAYLMPDVDDALLRKAMSRPFKEGWWEPQAGAIHLGAVRFERLQSSVVRMRATFEVPELPVGSYSLMFCTQGCAEAVGDLVPTEIEMVSSPAHAEAANRADRLEQRVWSLRHSKRHEVRTLKKQLVGDKELLSEANRQIASVGDDLGTQLAAMREQISERAGREGRPALHAPSLLLGALAAGCVMLLLRRNGKDDAELQAIVSEWEREQVANLEGITTAAGRG